MHAERTPNPDSLKWVVARELVTEGVRAQFDAAPRPEVSPLAARLFAIDGVAAVYVAEDFVTVTRRGGAEWPALGERITAALREFAASGDAALGPDFASHATAAAGGDDVVARIREVLDGEIRPALALDGGDVVFAGYANGVVEVVLRGACRGCPGSSATLTRGIEARLREAVPEVEEVVAL